MVAKGKTRHPRPAAGHFGRAFLKSANSNESQIMILKKGEKVHVIHRRHFEKDPHRHFVGSIEHYEDGVARVTGHVYTVDY